VEVSISVGLIEKKFSFFTIFKKILNDVNFKDVHPNPLAARGQI